MDGEDSAKAEWTRPQMSFRKAVLTAQAWPLPGKGKSGQYLSSQSTSVLLCEIKETPGSQGGFKIK
jgi:hypothetical protein